MKIIYLLIVIFIACEQQYTVKQIISKSIHAHGMNDSISISLTFRGSEYTVYRNNGVFKYSKHFNDTLDVLSNNGFKRIVNGKRLSLSVQDSASNSMRLNSVVYFSILPAPLTDDAVHPVILGVEELNDRSYYKIKVKFSEENGGVDFEDIYIYWINSETFLIDYFAYSYHINGGGSRFRTATKRHYLDGVVLSDYDNYKSQIKINLSEYLTEFGQSKLTKVSEINLKNTKYLYHYNSTKK